MGLKILHISDIHFKHFNEKGYLDLDKDIQNEIEYDLSVLKKDYNNIDVILIGGDIAFSGAVNEYAEADRWIKRICEITGCKEENVLMIPGNHDVDRSKFNPVLKNLHKSFKKLRSRNDIDYQISEFIKDAESAAILLSPFHNYRAFAQKYGSIPEDTNLLYWEKDFNMDNSVLRIRGVNSALISNESDDEHTSKLILGSHQSSMVRDQGVVYLVLCHHPPQWLYDNDDTARDFNARAKLILYGHKHTFSADIVNNSLILSAGAMQPSRSESEWEPRYNIIDLQINNTADPIELAVKVYERKWNKKDKAFYAEYSRDGETFKRFSLKLTEHEIRAHDETTKNVEDNDNELEISSMAENIIDPSVPDPKRKLAFMFLSLPYHTKLVIAVKLELIDDSDSDLEEIKKTQNYFRRAIEKGKLRQLWDEVVKESNTNLTNPF